MSMFGYSKPTKIEERDIKIKAIRRAESYNQSLKQYRKEAQSLQEIIKELLTRKENIESENQYRVRNLEDNYLEKQKELSLEKQVKEQLIGKLEAHVLRLEKLVRAKTKEADSLKINYNQELAKTEEIRKSVEIILTENKQLQEELLEESESLQSQIFEFELEKEKFIKYKAFEILKLNKNKEENQNLLDRAIKEQEIAKQKGAEFVEQAEEYCNRKEEVEQLFDEIIIKIEEQEAFKEEKRKLEKEKTFHINFKRDLDQQALDQQVIDRALDNRKKILIGQQRALNEAQQKIN